VPSRPYSSLASEKSLPGACVSTKDKYNPNGIQTTMTSRDHAALYEPQTPLGSTTGGATALANYPWLDYSVGTDSEFFVNYA